MTEDKPDYEDWSDPEPWVNFYHGTTVMYRSATPNIYGRYHPRTRAEWEVGNPNAERTD